MQSALQNVGFGHTSSQAMMVRHTVKHTRKLVPVLSDEMKKKAVAAQRQWFSHTAEPDSTALLEEVQHE